MNRTKVILSIFLMLFLLLAGLVLPSFWKSQKKEASGNKGREPAKETTETNSDTPMPEYMDFDALKAFFSGNVCIIFTAKTNQIQSGISGSISYHDSGWRYF